MINSRHEKNLKTNRCRNKIYSFYLRKFNKNDGEFKSLNIQFRERVIASALDMEQSEIDKIIDHLDVIIDEWHSAARDGGINRYDAGKGGQQFNSLLKEFGKTKRKGLWDTLNSMRNVDTETSIKVMGEN